MNPRPTLSLVRWLPVTLALAFALLACQALAPQPTPTLPPDVDIPATPSPTITQPTLEPTPLPPEPTPAPSLPPTPVAPPPTPAPTQAAALNASGPWLLLALENGLWAANPDGSGLTQLTQDTIVGPVTLQRGVQPGGRLVAYISGDADRTHNLALRLVSLPDGAVRTLTPLTNPNTEPGEIGFLDDKTEAVRAITDMNSLDWSPDGQMLAFISVQDGPSADLYTWSPAFDQIRRLTDGPSQGYGPHFSPDGRFIVHFGVNSFGTGAGYSMAGGWAAWASGAGVKTLFTGGGSGQEFAGWVNERQFLINAWRPDCGPQDLRVMDVETGAAKSLVKGCFSSVVAMPNAGGALVAGGYDNGDLVGLWQIDPATAARTQILPEPVNWLTTENLYPDVLAQSGSNNLVIGSGGKVMASAPPGECSYGYGVAGYGMIYAWTCAQEGPNAGAWINGPGIETRKVFDGPALQPAWSPQNTLLFASGRALYAALFFDYIPQPVAQLPGDVRQVAWVGWE